MSGGVMFRCAECGANVREATGPGRRSEYRRGIELPVPDDFAIPTCEECGEEYFTATLAKRLAKRQAPAYEAWLKERAAALIDQLRDQHATTQWHLESACGVTRTYFSHLVRGKRKPSLTLVRLLESFAASPAVLERYLPGRGAKPASFTAEALRSGVTVGTFGSFTSRTATGISLASPECTESNLSDAAPSNDTVAA